MLISEITYATEIERREALTKDKEVGLVLF